MDTLYTIGEIFRRGLLRNNQGKPYTSKGTVAHVARLIGTTPKQTPWGVAQCLTQEQIDAHNNKYQH